MLDFWADEVPAGSTQAMKVFVINDRESPWQGTVSVRVLRDGKEVSSQSQPCTIEGFGRQILSFTQAMPKEAGKYLVQADLSDGGKRVRSLRDVKVAK